MSHAGPFNREFWIKDGVELAYEHNVVPFPSANARANAAQAAQLLEEDRLTFEVVPTRAEERRLWEAYMAAIRKSVEAQEEVNKAHNAWMNFAERVS